MKIRMGTPKLVAEGADHLWFPGLDVMPTGQLIVRCSATPDRHGMPAVGAYTLSNDGGDSWAPLAWLPYAGPATFPSHDELVHLPRRWAHGNADHTACRSHRVVLQKGGTSYRLERDALQVVGLPRPVGEWTPGEPGFVNDCRIVRLADGRLMTGMYGTFAGDRERHAAARAGKAGHGYSLLVLESHDGTTWEYLSTVADWTMMPEAPEGPDESSLVELDDGELLSVFRVGMFEEWPLRASRSRDGGRTWSEPSVLPAGSVYPSLIRAANGWLVLTTGRPGIQLWVSRDGRGDAWEHVDVRAHHNDTVNRDDFRIRDTDSWNRTQTTSYTRIREIAPNQMLMVYDRIPCDWQAVPADSAERNRIFVLPIDLT